MQTATKEFYDSCHDIKIDVEHPLADQDATIDSMRESLKSIARSKVGNYAGMRLVIGWKINNQYFSESVGL